MLRNKFLMKKIKNIIILVIILATVFNIYKYINNSKAEEKIEVQIQVTDKADMQEETSITVEATIDDNEEYLVNLPETINNKYISKWYDENGEELVQLLTISEENAETETYLELEVEYDTKEIESTEQTEIFYNQKLQNEEEVILEGYMPDNSELQLENKEITEENSQIEVNGEIYNVQKTVDISIISNEQEYQPAEYDEDVEVKIKIEDTEKTYKVFHQLEDGGVEEMNVTKSNGFLIFTANKFSEYTVAEDTDSSTDSSYSSWWSQYAGIWNGQYNSSYDSTCTWFIEDVEYTIDPDVKDNNVTTVILTATAGLDYIVKGSSSVDLSISDSLSKSSFTIMINNKEVEIDSEDINLEKLSEVSEETKESTSSTMYWSWFLSNSTTTGSTVDTITYKVTIEGLSPATIAGDGEEINKITFSIPENTITQKSNGYASWWSAYQTWINENGSISWDDWFSWSGSSSWGSWSNSPYMSLLTYLQQYGYTRKYIYIIF